MPLLNELNYGEVLGKQKSVTRLFPKYTERENAVRKQGGIRLDKIKNEVWFFKVHSGTKSGVWYNCKIRFRNIKGIIVDKIENKEFRTPKGEVSMLALANYILQNADLELSCDDPSDLYWAFQYIRTQSKAKYGEPENRAPKRNNVSQKGFMCKHLGVLVEQLPMYGLIMVKFLNANFKEYLK